VDAQRGELVGRVLDCVGIVPRWLRHNVRGATSYGVDWGGHNKLFASENGTLEWKRARGMKQTLPIGNCFDGTRHNTRERRRIAMAASANPAHRDDADSGGEATTTTPMRELPAATRTTLRHEVVWTVEGFEKLKLGVGRKVSKTFRFAGHEWMLSLYADGCSGEYRGRAIHVCVSV
jgi:hypothetical protein